jgi:hypothetical protein
MVSVLGDRWEVMENAKARDRRFRRKFRKSFS